MWILLLICFCVQSNYEEPRVKLDDFQAWAKSKEGQQYARLRKVYLQETWNSELQQAIEAKDAERIKKAKEKIAIVKKTRASFIPFLHVNLLENKQGCIGHLASQTLNKSNETVSAHDIIDDRNVVIREDGKFIWLTNIDTTNIPRGDFHTTGMVFVVDGFEDYGYRVVRLRKIDPPEGAEVSSVGHWIKF